MRFGFRRILHPEQMSRLHSQACLAQGLPESSRPFLQLPKTMSDTITVHGHEIIDLIASHPGGIRFGQLMETVCERFGRMATFHTCSSAGMNLDELLHFLEARDKVRITSGVIYPGGTPACEH